jgi:hypothetical protein
MLIEKKITGALLGGSTRKLVISNEYIGLLTALNAIDESGEVTTKPVKVKEITCNYFQKLYNHDEPPDVPKPWMQSPSVAKIKMKVTSDPFCWQKPANIDDFQVMIRLAIIVQHPDPTVGKNGLSKLIRQCNKLGNGST